MVKVGVGVTECMCGRMQCDVKQNAALRCAKRREVGVGQPPETGGNEAEKKKHINLK